MTVTATPLSVTVQQAKALAHPARLRILALLHQGPLPVCQITSVLHSVASTVSGHLLDLRRSGLVVEQRHGKFVYYRVADDPAVSLLLTAVFCSLDEDHQIRHDAVLGESIRAMSPLIVCEGLPESPEEASRGQAPGSGRTAPGGVHRS